MVSEDSQAIAAHLIDDQLLPALASQHYLGKDRLRGHRFLPAANNRDSTSAVEHRI